MTRPAAMEQGASLEAFEHALHLERVAALQDQAATGEFGEPIYFLAGKELEFFVSPNPQMVEELQQPIVHDDIAPLVKQHSLLLPNPYQQQLCAEAREARLAALRQEAKDYISQLEPADTAQAARQAKWLAEIDGYTISDIVNFQLYREFSVPTLGPTQVPKGASYAQMIEYGEQRGWLEFRFGKGSLQSGFYDDANESIGISETRFTPCEPTELLEREAIVTARLTELATELGAFVSAPNTHINLSAYQYDAATRSHQPVIGRDEAREGKTMDAVTGLGAAIEDGVWFTGETADAKDLFNESCDFWQIDTNRNTVRIQDDYLELREQNMAGTTGRALTWMMAGVTYGLQHGRNKLAQEGYTRAGFATGIVIRRSPSYDKHVDLALQRALERSEIEDGMLILSNHHALTNGRDLADAIVGKEAMDDKVAALFAKLVIGALGVYHHALGFNKTLYQMTAALMSPKGDGLELLGDQATVAAIESHIARDAIRFHVEPMIRVIPKFPGLSPDEWEERWHASPIMDRAYGEHAKAYASRLADRGRLALAA